MSKPALTVLGDLMLDVFSEGSVSRISPEAPVPVLANPANREVLGGAGNTAVNMARLGAVVSLIAAVGKDESALTCDRLAEAAHLTTAFISSASCSTTMKQRFLAGGHQILRLDLEWSDLQDEDEDQLIAQTEKMLSHTSCLVISDYQKGVVTARVAREVMILASERDVPVVVDSKRRDFEVFQGARAITPNHMEATNATGETDPERAARALSAKTRGPVIVTLGPEGMLVLDETDSITRIPSEVREVSDVTGAGDTVTAALAVAVGQGATLVEAARWATLAAAVAVEHRGTYAVSRDELPPLATPRSA